MRDKERPLWSLTARELGVAYGDGLSPNEVVAATLAHIRTINPHLNAIITLDEAGAVRSAEDSAERWKSARPLSARDGVPSRQDQRARGAATPRCDAA